MAVFRKSVQKTLDGLAQMTPPEHRQPSPESARFTKTNTVVQTPGIFPVTACVFAASQVSAGRNV
jgi:hypothetical protein